VVVLVVVAFVVGVLVVPVVDGAGSVVVLGVSWVAVVAVELESGWAFAAVVVAGVVKVGVVMVVAAVVVEPDLGWEQVFGVVVAVDLVLPVFYYPVL
jgi:hypothetical protein